MPQVKEPARPPYVFATEPTTVLHPGQHHTHMWSSTGVITVDNVDQRQWSCDHIGCNAHGVSVELRPKP